MVGQWDAYEVGKLDDVMVVSSALLLERYLVGMMERLRAELSDDFLALLLAGGSAIWLAVSKDRT